MESNLTFDISWEQWVEEIAALTERSGAKSFFVQVSWPFGRLQYAIASPPQVNGRVIEIPLQLQSPSGLVRAGIEIFLPEDQDLVEYQKHESDSGDILLTAKWLEPGEGWTNFGVATNLEPFGEASSVTRVH